MSPEEKIPYPNKPHHDITVHRFNDIEQTGVIHTPCPETEEKNPCNTPIPDGIFHTSDVNGDYSVRSRVMLKDYRIVQRVQPVL